MSNVPGNYTPKDPRFYKKVKDAFRFLNLDELARLGFLDLGMDPTGWVTTADHIAGDMGGTTQSIRLKAEVCKNGFSEQNSRSFHAGSTDEEMSVSEFLRTSDITDALRDEKFFRAYEEAKNVLESRKLPIPHLEVAKFYLDTRGKNPELFHNFKRYWRGHESQKSLIPSNIFLAGAAASVTGLATGIYCQRKLSGGIEGAIQETGGECADLIKIRAEDPFTLSTPAIYKAGQCFEGAPQQEQFYGAVGHNVFWANASMAMGCAGMAVMIASGISLIKESLNSGKI